VTRVPGDRLADITEALDAISDHLKHGDLTNMLVLDAVITRLFVIGEAARALPPELIAREPSVRWRQIIQLRDLIAHHYYRLDPVVMQTIIDRDLPVLREAVRRLQALTDDDGG
jgi:uncharacterized protein with HEPN domain